jgi:hypothetical protein
MREHLKPETIANRIRMKRPQFYGAFLIVEGDSDSRLLRNFIVTGSCELVVAFGKDNLLGALAILNAEQRTGVLAIADADFRRLEGPLPAIPNLHFTDTHDLETMLLQSPALEKVLSEFGSETKLKTFAQTWSLSLREVLLASGSWVGYLRWASLRQPFNLKFEGVKFSKFISDETLAVDDGKLVKAVKDHSQAPHLNDADLLSSIQQLHDVQHDQWQVCCGHDLVEILSAGLRKALGTNDAKQVEPERLTGALRLAYEFTYFCATLLYAEVRKWEVANPSYQVFSQNNQL